MRISIIGAGPAGAIAATRLARAGASVSLFDPSHPREKPCGGGLTGRALSLVCDVIDIATLGPVCVSSATVESPIHRDHDWPARPAHVPLVDRGASAASALLVVSRAVFDRALLHAAIAAGARLVPEKVTDVCRQPKAMIVHTSRGRYETDFVLGADGANSIVRKKLAVPFTRAQMSVAAGFFVHGVSSCTIAIASVREQPGYLWSFPRRDHLAVGICAPAAERVSSTTLRAQTLTWIERHGLHRAAAMEPYAWPIPSAGFEDAVRMTCAGSGWMLLGDAAGLVDPLTREGIYYALLSGGWAAEALTSATPERAAALYSDRLRHVVQPELARAARLSTLFFSPRFSSLFVDALRQSAPIREVFADLVAGVQPYCGLRRRLLRTREWRLAGASIRLAVTPAFAGTIRRVVSPQAT
jgi:geranylgeranyl reductase family protein